MTDQFVDLFDKEKYGLAYWAGIMVAVGMLLGFLFNAGDMVYRVLVDGVRFSVEGEPMTLGRMLVRSLRFEAVTAIGFGVVLVASAHLAKRDLILPVAAGVLTLLWGIVMRVTGVLEGPAFSPALLISAFVWALVTYGSLIVMYRLLRNKMMALSLGMAMGALLSWVINTIRYSIPLVYAAESVAAALCTSFIAGLFLYAGIAKHFSSRGMYFGEFGLDSEGTSATAASAADPALGKTRRPLVTLLLMLVTLNLYTFGWIYKTFKEIRQRDSAATEIPAGRALGFLFIPIFNFFWVIRIFIEIPRAIERMGRADPPTGHSPPAGLIAGCMVAAIVAGITSRFWTPAFYLNGAGPELAQQPLARASHSLHRGRGIMKLGDVLRIKREHRRISAEHVAAALGISQNEYAAIESGDSPAEVWGPILS